MTDEATPRGDGFGAALAARAIEYASDEWWNAQGGPWCAQYRRVASLAAIGIGEGNPHRVHFMDPADALEHFRQLPARYQRNATLRHDCLIVYKDNWYCVEPFADDADHAVDVMREEVARDEGRWHDESFGRARSSSYADGAAQASA
jgi:hypothetical protein